MANGFGNRGGQSSRKVGMLVGLLILLFVCVILIAGYIFKQIQADQASENEAAANASATKLVVNSAQSLENQTVKIFIARQRIEEGALLTEQLFLEETRKPMDVPRDAVTSDQRANVFNGKYAKVLINPNSPLINDYITATPPISELQIPSGFRAITITVDARRGVEGWAKPGSRVDILWTYTDTDGSKKVATIVRFVKVLSVAGQQGMAPDQNRANVGGDTTITLLVEEYDAKRIELARTLGELSLTLAGGIETAKQSSEDKPVTADDVLGRTANAEKIKEETPPDGRMYMKDPATGDMVLYELRKNRWQRAE